MIAIIQGLVIIAALSLLAVTLGGRRTHVARAWKKLAICFLAVAMVVAVLFPDLTNRLANIVGVGRGADLLLYILSLAFIVYVVNSYLYQQQEKDALYRLARKVALMETIEKYKLHDK
jgi:small membrane protein